MNRRIAKLAYNFTGNCGWLFIEASSRWPLGHYFMWPHRLGSWFYGKHDDIAEKYGWND